MVIGLIVGILFCAGGAVLPASEQGPIDTPPPKGGGWAWRSWRLCCALLLAGVLGLSGYVVLSTRDRVLTTGDSPRKEWTASWCWAAGCMPTAPHPHAL